MWHNDFCSRGYYLTPHAALQKRGAEREKHITIAGKKKLTCKECV